MGQVELKTILAVSVIYLVSRSMLGQTEVSKACYGQPGLQCTSHKLRCNSGTIVIQEAFYMESAACPITGVYDCGIGNLKSIPLTRRLSNFSGTELDSLYGNCSRKSICSHQAGRTGGAYPSGFSVIVYYCIHEEKTERVKTSTTTLSVTEATTAQTLTVSETSTTASKEVFCLKQASETKTSIGGMFAAGLVTGLGIAAVVICVVYILYIRRRCLKNPDPGSASLSDRTYSGLSDRGPPDTYDVINRPKGGTRPSEDQTPVYQNVS